MIRTNTAKWLPKYSRWQINVQKDGIRRTFTSSKKGRTGQREANAKADAWLESNIIDWKIRVDKLTDLFLEEKSLNVGKQRMDTLRSRFRVWVLPAIGRKKVSEVTEQDLQNILNNMYRSDKSKNMIDGVRQMLCEFMRFARKNALTTLYPEFLETPRLARPKQERNILSESDLITLFTNDKTIYFGQEVIDKYINHYRFAAATGLRRGELLGLKWSDINGNIIHVQRSYTPYKEFTDGKTSNACRDIPMTVIAENIIRQMPHNGEFVFNTGITPMTLTARYRQYAEYHDFSAVLFHELRHTFITMMDSVIPINVLKSVVGHSEAMDTVGVYGHKNDAEMNVAKLKIDEKFSNVLQSVLF